MVIGCIALLQQSCSRLFTTWFSDVLSRSLVDNNMRVALEVVWELEAGGLPYSLAIRRTTPPSELFHLHHSSYLSLFLPPSRQTKLLAFAKRPSPTMSARQITKIDEHDVDFRYLGCLP